MRNNRKNKANLHQSSVFSCIVMFHHNEDCLCVSDDAKAANHANCKRGEKETLSHSQLASFICWASDSLRTSFCQQHYCHLSSISFIFCRSIRFLFLLVFETKRPPHSVVQKLVRSPFSLSFPPTLSWQPRPLPVNVGSVFPCAPVCKHITVKMSPLWPK